MTRRGFTKQDSKDIEQAVARTIVLRYSWRESLQYIKDQIGFSITEQGYYKVKKRLMGKGREWVQQMQQDHDSFLSEYRQRYGHLDSIAEILTRYYEIDVTNLIHEVASNGQIEINFKHNTLTRSSDNVQIYKDVVRNTAKQHNKVANFMPKPIFNREDLGSTSGNDNGSGMHTSISLWDGAGNNNNNIFYD